MPPVRNLKNAKKMAGDGLVARRVDLDTISSSGGTTLGLGNNCYILSLVEEEALEWVLSQFDSPTTHHGLRNIVLNVRQGSM
jgi:hypothetical protein